MTEQKPTDAEIAAALARAGITVPKDLQVEVSAAMRKLKQLAKSLAAWRP
jgi:hypothetical protein